MALQTADWVWHEDFPQVGVRKLLCYHGEDAPAPLMCESREDVVDRLIDNGIALVGTVNQVKLQLESLVRCHGDGDLEWFDRELCQKGVLFIKVVLEQIETFRRQILPNFKS